MPQTDTAIINQTIFVGTKKQRVQAGMSSLIFDSELAEIATAHSKGMLIRDYMDHISPEGDGPSDRVSKANRKLFGWVGENTATRLYSSGCWLLFAI